MAANRHGRVRGRWLVEEIVNYLGGLGYPCSKDDIVRLVVAGRAPGQVVTALESLPEERYSSLNDITRHFGRTM